LDCRKHKVEVEDDAEAAVADEEIEEVGPAVPRGNLPDEEDSTISSIGSTSLHRSISSSSSPSGSHVEDMAGVSSIESE